MCGSSQQSATSAAERSTKVLRTMLSVMPPLESRRRLARRMQVLRYLLWLPTRVLLVPFLRIQERLGHGDRLLRRLGRSSQAAIACGQSFNDYRPDDGDLIVCTYFRSGTNWALQIAHQIAGFWAMRHRPNVLLLFFSEMQAELARTVERVAAFMGVALAPAQLRRVV
jgi:hypothetical protein